MSSNRSSSIPQGSHDGVMTNGIAVIERASPPVAQERISVTSILSTPKSPLSAATTPPSAMINGTRPSMSNSRVHPENPLIAVRNTRLLDLESGLKAMSSVNSLHFERAKVNECGDQQSTNYWKMLSDVRKRSLNRAKLKQSSQVSALLSGFALVGMVELNVPDSVPFGLLLFFIIVTTALVSVHMIALLISTCILPHIESINEMEERASSLKFYEFNQPSTNCSVEHNPPDNRSNLMHSRVSSYEKMAFYISIAWSCSTVIGIFLFILELAVIVWVKFYGTPGGTTIAIVSTALLVPVLISLIFFAFHFYHKLVSIRYEFTERVMNDVNLMAHELV